MSDFVSMAMQSTASNKLVSAHSGAWITVDKKDTILRAAQSTRKMVHLALSSLIPVDDYTTRNSAMDQHVRNRCQKMGIAYEARRSELRALQVLKVHKILPEELLKAMAPARSATPDALWERGGIHGAEVTRVMRGNSPTEIQKGIDHCLRKVTDWLVGAYELKTFHVVIVLLPGQRSGPALRIALRELAKNSRVKRRAGRSTFFIKGVPIRTHIIESHNNVDFGDMLFNFKHKWGFPHPLLQAKYNNTALG